VTGEDEGIVQAAAKAAGQLSPRLHHLLFPGPPGPGSADALGGKYASYSSQKFAYLQLSSRLVWLKWCNVMKLEKQLSPCEAAYVAGIIDGEGTITLTRTHRGENRRPVVSISSTERPLLDYVLKVVGAGRITNKVRTRDHHSPSFAYMLSSRGAIALLSQVSPFLQTYKSGRARLLVEEYLHVTARNGRYTAAQRDRRAAFENRFFSMKTRGGVPSVQIAGRRPSSVRSGA
jgi:hypothetical protein